MGGPRKLETKAARAAQIAAEFLGISIEEVKIEMPIETKDDKMAEAEAVTLYFETNGQKFTHVYCRWCGELFAYAWDRHAIRYCSVEHAAEALKQKYGLRWDPTREQSRRWGKTAPAVVPAEALREVHELLALKIHRTDDVPEKVELGSLEQQDPDLPVPIQ